MQGKQLREKRCIVPCQATVSAGYVEMRLRAHQPVCLLGQDLTRLQGALQEAQGLLLAVEAGF